MSSKSLAIGSSGAGRITLTIRLLLPVIFILMGSVAVSVPVLAATRQNTLNAIRVQPLSNRHVQVVLETQQRPQYKQFGLRKPARVVVDLKNTRWNLTKMPRLTGTNLLRIRHSIRQKNPHELRLVFDLRSPVMASTKPLPPRGRYRYRVIMDLTSRKGLSTANSASKNASAYRNVKTAILKPSARKILVVIDPGHGGTDPGAIGVRKTYEKRVVLSIAKKLKANINKQSGFKAVLTRTGDYYIPLRNRLAIARRYKTDMFISIHADAFHKKRSNGAAVYALSNRGATSEATRWLAERENRSELMGGVNLADKDNVLRSVLIDLSQTATINASLEVGQKILQQLTHVARLHHRRVEQAAFVVLKSPDIPSLLVETGFLSNPKEAMKLRTSWYQQRIANAITKGVISYFKSHPPRGTYLALQREKRRHASISLTPIRRG